MAPTLLDRPPPKLFGAPPLKHPAELRARLPAFVAAALALLTLLLLPLSLPARHHNHHLKTKPRPPPIAAQVLRPFLLRRMIKDVEQSLPPKNERVLRADMTPLQKAYYRWVISRNFKELNKSARCGRRAAAPAWGWLAGWLGGGRWREGFLGEALSALPALVCRAPGF